MALDIPISIITTHWSMDHRRARLAKESFDSLIESVAHLPVEVVVVDNGGEVDCSPFFLARQNAGKIHTYIRNASNLSFGEARNQAIALSWGHYLVVVDNDLIYEKGWLEACIEALEAYPDRLLIASPVDYTDNRPGFQGGMLGKYKLHQRAGSNCFVMRRKTWEEVGPFKPHRVAGSIFTDKLVKAYYRTIIAGHGLVKDIGLRRGYNHHIPAVVERKLLDGSVLTKDQEGDITHRYA